MYKQYMHICNADNVNSFAQTLADIFTMLSLRTELMILLLLLLEPQE